VVGKKTQTLIVADFSALIMPARAEGQTFVDAGERSNRGA
jgi:hypothetical protein